MFRPNYRAFRYRLTLPIVAGCVGSIGALLIMTEMNSIFLVDALYHLALVREHPDFIFVALNVVAYAFGGYYATKYALKLAHTLDDRRNTAMNDRTILASAGKSLSDVGRDLFKKEEPIDPMSHKGKDS